MWTIKYSKQAVKDSKKIEQSNLKQSVINLLEILKLDPFQNPPPYDKTKLESLKNIEETNQTYKDFIDYLSGHLEFNAEYTYLLISEICNSIDDCYYYGLGVK